MLLDGTESRQRLYLDAARPGFRLTEASVERNAIWFVVGQWQTVSPEPEQSLLICDNVMPVKLPAALPPKRALHTHVALAEAITQAIHRRAVVRQNGDQLT